MPSTKQDAAASSSPIERKVMIDRLQKLCEELQEMNGRLSEEQELECQGHRDFGEDKATARHKREASDKWVEENIKDQLERLKQKKELQKQVDKASEGIIQITPRLHLGLAMCSVL